MDGVARESETLAELRRALGAQLATFRLAANLTQGQLARIAYCDRTTLVHIEKGRARADERFWRAVDDACRADGVLLAAFLELEAAKAGYEHREREQRLAAVQAKAAELRVRSERDQGCALLPAVRAQHVPQPIGLLSPVWNTALLDIDEAISVAARQSTKFLARAEAENVGELSLEQIQSEVWRISRAYLKEPTAPLFVRTCEVRDRAFASLDGWQRPRHARDLYVAAGWSLTVLAWMSIDLGRPDAGEDHARTAWLCAGRAEHDGLRAWVRATQHTAAFWQDDFVRAARLAADGLNYATGSAALFLASAYALDLARSGQDERAWEALGKAQRCAETSRQSADELGGPFTCGFDRASGFWSDTQLALGAAQAALADADRAVTTFEAQPLERRNQGSERMVRMQQARAYLALGQLDGAEDTLMPVLDPTPEHRMRPLLIRMHDVYVAAAKPEYRHEPIAKRICDAAMTFQRDTVTKELPA